MASPVVFACLTFILAIQVYILWVIFINTLNANLLLQIFHSKCDYAATEHRWTGVPNGNWTHHQWVGGNRHQRNAGRGQFGGNRTHQWEGGDKSYHQNGTHQWERKQHHQQHQQQ